MSIADITLNQQDIGVTLDATTGVDINLPVGTGPGGPAGPTGPTGPGVAAGGTVGQVLRKASATDYDTAWLTLGAAALLAVGTTAGTVAAGDDTRFTDARTPTGTAGGVLAGTYPNPSFAATAAESLANVPAGNLSAITVQAALNELDTEKAALIGAAITGAYAWTLATTTTDAITTAVTADTNPRLTVNADGTLEWGPGNAAPDTALSRIAANILGTASGDAFVVGGASLTIGTNPAATGTIRLANAGAISARNAANTGDITALGVNAANQIVVGNNSATIVLYGLASATAGISVGDGQNVAVGSTTGTKIGTAANQKIGKWGATPDVQPTTGITGGTFVENSGTALNSGSTVDGYTFAQVVAALRRSGDLA